MDYLEGPLGPGSKQSFYRFVNYNRAGKKNVSFKCTQMKENDILNVCKNSFKVK